MTVSTMRVWQSPRETGIDSINIAEAAVPSPGEGELLVRVDAAALNFSDLLMIDFLGCDGRARATVARVAIVMT